MQGGLVKSLMGFVAGVGLASFLPIGIVSRDVVFFSLAIVFLIMAFFVQLFFSQSTLQVRLILSFCIIAFLFLGVWRFSLTEIAFQANSFKSLAGKEVALSGKVDSEMQAKYGINNFQVSDLKIKNKYFSGKILVKTQSVVDYGSYVKMTCKIELPEQINDFRYDRYLAKDGVLALCVRPTGFEVYASPQSLKNKVLAWLFSQKSKLRSSLVWALPINEASLLGGVMLGDGYLMPKELKDSYGRSGLTHIVAISGLNMTLIAIFLMWFFVQVGFWRLQATAITLVSLGGYTIFVGAPSSAVRAVVMSSLVLIAYAIGRRGNMIRLLLLAVVAMLVYEPFYMREDVGFQLSVLALYGLIVFSEPLGGSLKNKLNFLPATLVDVLAVTLSAQILTWPILALNFGQVSVVAPVANLLAIWLVTPMMLFAGLGLAINGVMVWQYAYYPAFWLARLLNEIATALGSLSMATMEVNYLPIVLTVSYYCCIIIVIHRIYNDKNPEN